MKNLLFGLVLVLTSAFAFEAHAQVSTLTAFSAQGYPKASTAEDTSATLSLGGYPYITMQTTSTGSDSTPMVSKIDAYINGVWVNNIVSSTLTVGRPAAHIIGSATKGQVNYLLIRSPGTTTTDVIGGATTIRIRNVHSAFANGSTDSTSALTYTQKIIMRKP